MPNTSTNSVPLNLTTPNTQVFDKDVAKNIVQDYFSDKLYPDNYTLKIDPKSKPEEFWQVVEESKEIYDLTVKINAPNHPLFGDEEFREAIKQLRNETNNEEAVLSVRSSTGQLNLLGRYVRSMMHYVSVVGGFWKLKVIKKENKRVSNIDSYNQIEKVSLPKDLAESDRVEIEKKLIDVNGIPELEKGNLTLPEARLPEEILPTIPRPKADKEPVKIKRNRKK